MAIAPVVVGTQIDPTTFGNAVVDEINHRGQKGWALGPTADQGPLGAGPTDMTNLSKTFTADPTRVYRTTVTATVQQNTTPSVPQLIIANAAGTALIANSMTAAAGDAIAATLVYLETGISGSTTRKARIGTAAGTVTVVGTFTRRSSIVVEDLGPA